MWGFYYGGVRSKGMETVEVTHDALEALWGHVDVSAMKDHNPEAVDEVSAILSAQESDRVTVVHE